MMGDENFLIGWKLVSSSALRRGRNFCSRGILQTLVASGIAFREGGADMTYDIAPEARVTDTISAR
jgi:hypothetical protein